MTFAKYVLFTLIVAVPTAFIVACIALSTVATTYPYPQ